MTASLSLRLGATVLASALLVSCGGGQSGAPQLPAPQLRPANAPRPFGQIRVPKRSPNYTVVILGGFGGNDSATAINESGDASGVAVLPGSQGVVHAAHWRKGVITDLGTLGGIFSGISFADEGHSINDRDVITGSSETATPDPNAENICGPSGLECRPYVWKRGTMTALPTLGGNNAVGQAINSRGQVVGTSETSTKFTCQAFLLYVFFGFIWDRGRMTKLPPESGDNATLATGINDRGDVVGTSGNCAVAAHSVLWKGGTIRDLGNLGGTDGNLPAYINNREEVVGEAQLPSGQHHAFLWRRGVMSDLGTLPGDVDSHANAINNNGQIAGFSSDAYSNNRAVLWSDGAIYDLNTLIPPSSRIFLQEAEDINDRGQISGYGCVKCDGSDQLAFLAIPTNSYSIVNVAKSGLPSSGRAPVAIMGILRAFERRYGWARP